MLGWVRIGKLTLSLRLDSIFTIGEGREREKERESERDGFEEGKGGYIVFTKVHIG